MRVRIGLVATLSLAVVVSLSGCSGDSPDHTGLDSSSPRVTTPTGPTHSTTEPLVLQRNVCSMIDVEALRDAEMSPALDAPVSMPPVSVDDSESHGCANDLGEVSLHIEIYRDVTQARQAADHDTQDPSGPGNPFPNAVRVPFGEPRGGAKLIATQTGISRVTWSNGVHYALLEINSDPEIRGVRSRHPFEVLDTLIDRLVNRADRMLTEGNW